MLKKHHALYSQEAPEEAEAAMAVRTVTAVYH